MSFLKFQLLGEKEIKKRGWLITESHLRIKGVLIYTIHLRAILDYKNYNKPE